MPVEKKRLDKYIAQLRRIAAHRQKTAEREIRKIYKEIMKDLNGFLGNEYAFYSRDGVLSVEILQEMGRYAKFLEEVEQHLDSLTPALSKAMRSMAEDVYEKVYTGMALAVEKCVENVENVSFTGSTLRPEVMKRAVENPVSGLTLPDILEKNRKEIIYQIKQEVGISLLTGSRYETTARNISEKLNLSYGKSIRIARTETHRVQEGGLMDCAVDIASDLEGSGLVYAGTWRNMGDERVRPQVRYKTKSGWKTKIRRNGANHVKMEGQTRKAGELFDLGGGVKAVAPSQSGNAGNDINCRCIIEYTLMTQEEYEDARENGYK